MKGLRKHRWVGGIVSGLALLLGGTFVFIKTRAHDPYGFLEGRAPEWSGVMERTVVGPGFCEYRVYSWEADFGVLRKQMEVEMPQLGFSRRFSTPKAVFWELRDGNVVMMEQRRSVTRREALLMVDGSDPNGVTIACLNLVPDVWLTRLRNAMEPKMGGRP